jgi:serine/threonine protein kinase
MPPDLQNDARTTRTVMTVSTLGRYQIVSTLGRGAMGTVYRAVDPAIERTVAIKTLNPDLPDENLAEVKERFLREAKSAGRLNHPNVVTVYDVGEANGIAYIAMEYLEGKSLRQLLDSGPQPLRAVVDIAAQIADALDYAQRYGIVHRDIKPANIMLSPGGLAKLTDFGVAYMPSSSMTQTGAVLGSPKYLSPEQCLGLPVDGRADIFALGIVLFEMLARKTPFEGPDITVFNLMQRICTEPAPPITKVNREVPSAFDYILGRALAKRPEERYQRAAEFAGDLRNYQQLTQSSTDQTVITRPVAYEATAVVRPGGSPGGPPPSRPQADDPQMQEKMAKLLEDLDAFSQNYDLESSRLAQAAQERAETEARAKAEEEARQRQDATTSTARPKSALIGLLQEQAKAKAQQHPNRPSLESVQALNAKMKQAFAYLVEFVSEFNAATPAFAGKLALLYVGNLPEPTLSRGFVDYRSTKIEDRQVIDYISLTYRMGSDEKKRLTLNKEEARMLMQQLERAEIKFEQREVEHALHKVPRVALAIDCSMVARARLTADYNSLAVDILCQNVGTVGATKFRIAADRFGEDALEELGKRILGLPDKLAGIKLPG